MSCSPSSSHPGADDGAGRGPTALAATKRLPIKSGPNGLSRASGGVTTKIVGGTGFGRGATGFPGVSTRLSNRGVRNCILSVTGGCR